MNFSELKKNYPKVLLGANYLINIIFSFIIPLLILSKLKNNPTIVALGLVIILLSIGSVYIALDHYEFLPVMNIIQMIFITSLIAYTTRAVSKDEKDRLKIKGNLVICYILFAFILVNSFISGYQIYKVNPFKMVPSGKNLPTKVPDIIIDIDFKNN